jgi:hypothetical protein
MAQHSIASDQFDAEVWDPGDSGFICWMSALLPDEHFSFDIQQPTHSPDFDM